MASNEQPPLSLSNTLGAVGVLGLVAIILYIWTCCQVMYYLVHYYARGDHTYITIFVLILWMMDTGKIVMDLMCGWEFLILRRGHAFTFLLKMPGTLTGELVVSLLLVFASFVGLVVVIQAQTANTMFDAFAKIKITAVLRPVSAALVDVYITAWLCYHLHNAKSGYTRSDNIIAKLINYAITRGIVTFIVQVLTFAFFLADYSHKELWFLIFYVIASPLYVNSLLAMWNARHHIVVSTDPPPQNGASGLSRWIPNMITVHTTSEDS
ncbi:hypothetical protein C8Q72DRAFT_920417 [Fomitopsis betulina]|nr:hypothetical protein C8Q72DRAFT_920417 [Fomitopsis betulina]